MKWVVLETTFPEPPLFFDPWSEEYVFAEISFLLVADNCKWVLNVQCWSELWPCIDVRIVFSTTKTLWPEKCFGPISGDVILFVSSKRRCLEARNFADILLFILITTWKNQLYRISRSEFYEWLCGPETFSGLSGVVPSLNSGIYMHRTNQL